MSNTPEKKCKTKKTKKTQKFSNSRSPTRKNTSSSSGDSSSGSPQRVWKSLKPKDQTLCKKVFPINKKELVNTCLEYEHNGNNLYLKYKYGLKDITEESSPILVFNEEDKADFSLIADGIHNFMLFWDDTTNKYTLVTAYFNAIEFGNKHNVISLRTVGKTPDTFIISGEIKKVKGNKTFNFHDTSSQFFMDNPCNIKTRMPVIYLFELVDQKGYDVSNITPEQLEVLKSDILSNNTFDFSNEQQIKAAKSFYELVDILEKRGRFIVEEDKPEKLKIYKKYTDFITSIMTDAFNRLFKTKTPSSALTAKYVRSFLEADYEKHGQNNIDTILGKLCKQKKPLPFDVYPDDNSCAKEVHKSEHNSCNMDKNTSDYIKTILPKKKSTPKMMETDKNPNYSDIQVFIDGVETKDDEIRMKCPNWMNFKSQAISGKINLRTLEDNIRARKACKDIKKIELKPIYPQKKDIPEYQDDMTI